MKIADCFWQAIRLPTMAQQQQTGAQHAQPTPPDRRRACTSLGTWRGVEVDRREGGRVIGLLVSGP